MKITKSTYLALVAVLLSPLAANARDAVLVHQASLYEDFYDEGMPRDDVDYYFFDVEEGGVYELDQTRPYGGRLVGGDNTNFYGISSLVNDKGDRPDVVRDQAGDLHLLGTVFDASDVSMVHRFASGALILGKNGMASGLAVINSPGPGIDMEQGISLIEESVFANNAGPGTRLRLHTDPDGSVDTHVSASVFGNYMTGNYSGFILATFDQETEGVDDVTMMATVRNNVAHENEYGFIAQGFATSSSKLKLITSDNLAKGSSIAGFFIAACNMFKVHPVITGTHLKWTSINDEVEGGAVGRQINAAAYLFINGPSSVSDCSVKARLIGASSVDVETDLQVRGGGEVPAWAESDITSNTVDLSIRGWVGDGDTALDIVENEAAYPGSTISGNDVSLGSRRSFDAASGLDSYGLGDQLFNP